MKLRFTPRATADLAAIADYLRQRSPSATQQVRAAILKSLQILVLFPHTGRKQPVAGMRKLVTRKYRYLVYYTVDARAGEIAIVSIQHAAQQRDHDHS